jgi:hypothetical protein
MSGGTVAGKMGVLGAFRIPKLCKNPMLTYDTDAVKITGKGFSGTIPVSAISAVLIETKMETTLLIVAIIAIIISIAIFAITVAAGGGGGGYGGGYGRGADNVPGGVVVGNILFWGGIILLVIYFRTQKAVFSIISDCYAYTLSIKGNEEILDDWKTAKNELSKIVVAGRKAVN